MRFIRLSFLFQFFDGILFPAAGVFPFQERPALLHPAELRALHFHSHVLVGGFLDQQVRHPGQSLSLHHNCTQVSTAHPVTLVLSYAKFTMKMVEFHVHITFGKNSPINPLRHRCLHETQPSA